MNNNRAAQLLRSARYNVARIDADLSRMRAPFTPDDMYHQGYQTGRKAELESLITILEMVVA
jgi:hypothetical protein